MTVYKTMSYFWDVSRHPSNREVFPPDYDKNWELVGVSAVGMEKYGGFVLNYTWRATDES